MSDIVDLNTIDDKHPKNFNSNSSKLDFENAGQHDNYGASTEITPETYVLPLSTVSRREALRLFPPLRSCT